MHSSITSLHLQDRVLHNLPFLVTGSITLLCCYLVWVLFSREEAPVEYVVDIPPQLRSDYAWDTIGLKDNPKPEVSIVVLMPVRV